MRWVGHVACMDTMIHSSKMLVRKPEVKNHVGNLGIDSRKILKWTLKE
jgi:hypothetical protein